LLEFILQANQFRSLCGKVLEARLIRLCAGEGTEKSDQNRGGNGTEIHGQHVTAVALESTTELRIDMKIGKNEGISGRRANTAEVARAC
jgi:hypothetical protein